MTAGTPHPWTWAASAAHDRHLDPPSEERHSEECEGTDGDCICDVGEDDTVYDYDPFD